MNITIKLKISQVLVLLLFHLDFIRCFPTTFDHHHHVPSQQQQQRLEIYSNNHYLNNKLQMVNDNNNDEKDEYQYDDPPLPFLVPAILVTSVLALWPLLALLRDTNSPTDGFDVDMFMALKGMLGSGGNDMTTAVTDDYYYHGDTIIELPTLSPAEQMVGAIFGPPH